MKAKANSSRRAASSSKKAASSSSSALRVQTILVPIDFSDPSKKALGYAVQFAGKFGAKLILFSVIEPVGTPDFPGSFPLVLDMETIIKESRASLDRLVQETANASSLVEKTIVREGRAFHEITLAAEELNVDLIIISTHGYTGLKHILMGSTAERVVRHAHCPVLVVR